MELAPNHYPTVTNKIVEHRWKKLVEPDQEFSDAISHEFYAIAFLSKARMQFLSSTTLFATFASCMTHTPSTPIWRYLLPGRVLFLSTMNGYTIPAITKKWQMCFCVLAASFEVSIAREFVVPHLIHRFDMR